MSALKADRIIYSTCDEDSVSELRALDLRPDDDVLSITGSGCRTLSLLAKGPRSVTSVDMSASQGYLLEVKLAAIRHFSYDSLLEFLGIEECSSRLQLFGEIEHSVSRPARDFFRENSWAVRGGLALCGRHEQFYIRLVAPAMRRIYGRALQRLFAASTLVEQRAIYRSELDGLIWRSVGRLCCSRFVLGMVLKHVAYESVVDVPSCGGYVMARLDHTLMNHLVRENDWLTFVLNGRYLSRDVLPHYLLRSNYESIRSAPTKVVIESREIVDFLTSARRGAYSTFSLSDVTSCISSRRFADLMLQVVRVSRPGARICYRNFLARHPVPPAVEAMTVREDSLCAELNDQDRAFVYEFEVLRMA